LSLFDFSRGGHPSNFYPPIFYTFVTEGFEIGEVAENKNSQKCSCFCEGCQFHKRV